MLMSSWAYAQESVTIPATKAEPAVEMLAKLTLKQKIGQLLIVGFPGTQYGHSLKKLIPRIQPGALIAFGRNVKSLTQVAELNRQAQRNSMKLNNLPLFIMVDQEGGSVARIKTTPPMPSALSLGGTNEPELVTQMGTLVGNLLSTVGFNFNLAPVLDIGDPKRPSFIGNRAFGGDTDLVSRMSEAFSRGLANAKIVPTAKHFPGHGGLTQDSHKKTPSKLMSLEELEANDLVPFKSFVKLDVPTAIMVAHVAFPHIDESGLPAAFSHVMISDILRDNLGYEGLVITDDIEMLGAEFAGTVGERAIKAVEAGCDMVMVAWSFNRQIEAFNALHAAVKDGRLTEERINQSVLRILRAKLKLDKVPQKFAPKHFKLKLNAHLAALREVTHKVHRQNFLRGAADAIQADPGFSESQRFLVFTSDSSFYSEFQKGTKNPSKLVRLTPATLKDVESELTNSPDALGIYYATGTATARKLNSIPREVAARLYVINGTFPGAVETPERFRAVIHLNSLDPQSGLWLAESLFNREPAPVPELTAPPDDLREPATSGMEDDQARNAY